jgi:Tetracyclin repressor-like, C-terminal domain
LFVGGVAANRVVGHIGADQVMLGEDEVDVAVVADGGGDPAAAVRAAQRSCDEFLAIAAAVVDEQNAQRYAAVLLTGAHGAAGLEMSGLLTTDKWHTTAEELTDTLIAMVAEADQQTHRPARRS